MAVAAVPRSGFGVVQDTGLAWFGYGDERDPHTRAAVHVGVAVGYEPVYRWGDQPMNGAGPVTGPQPDDRPISSHGRAASGAPG